MKVRVGALCLLLAGIVTVPVLAATRTVTIVVQQPNGAPVAGARVLVAADEMDAVGTTDAQGRVTVSTTSDRISVVADKGDAKGSTSGSATVLTVTLAGAPQ